MCGSSEDKVLLSFLVLTLYLAENENFKNAVNVCYVIQRPLRPFVEWFDVTVALKEMFRQVTTPAQPDKL